MKFDKTFVGQKAELTHLITARDLLTFTTLTGDVNKVHIDQHYAKRTALKTPIVHGMLTASFISTIIGVHLPGNGAIWKSQELQFMRPVRIGDTLTVKAEVIDRGDETDRELRMHTDVYNQDGDVVLYGTARVKLLE